MASFGNAGRKSSVEDIQGLMKAADDALYGAKHAGRDRVMVAGETTVRN